MINSDKDEHPARHCPEMRIHIGGMSGYRRECVFTSVRLLGRKFVVVKMINEDGGQTDAPFDEDQFVREKKRFISEIEDRCKS